jgi:pilus assembly protein Flp/PilA
MLTIQSRLEQQPMTRLSLDGYFSQTQRVYAMKWLSDLCCDDAGATMVEYGAMIALVAAVCVAAVTTIGTSINTALNTLVTALGG